MCKHIYNPETQYPKGTPFTYLIGWTELNIFYYGVRYSKYCHPDDLWKTYFTSSTPLKEFRELNGEPDIVKVDFIYDTKEEARSYEEEFLTERDAARSKNWLNKTNGNKKFFGRSGYITITKDFIFKKIKIELLQDYLNLGWIKKGQPISESHKQKVSEGLTGIVRSEETKKKISDAKIGIPQSPEHLKKNSESHKGIRQSEETIKKRTESTKGMKIINNGVIQKKVKPEELPLFLDMGWNFGCLEEYIKKNSESHKGIRQSEETKKKKSDANLGYKHTDEAKQKISDAKKGKPLSEEHKKNNGIAHSGLIQINNGEKQKNIKPEELPLFLDMGWIIGGLKKSEECCQIMSEKRKGKFLINNGEIQLFVTPEEAELLYTFGFLIGSLKKRF